MIHSFFVPALGVQRYAIPGRTIEMWLSADKPGVYYGQCNQICGQDHSRMPIAVRAVTDAEFKTWVEDQTKKTASLAPQGTPTGTSMGTPTGTSVGTAPGTPIGIPGGNQAGTRVLAAGQITLQEIQR